MNINIGSVVYPKFLQETRAIATCLCAVVSGCKADSNLPIARSFPDHKSPSTANRWRVPKKKKGDSL